MSISDLVLGRSEPVKITVQANNGKTLEASVVPEYVQHVRFVEGNGASFLKYGQIGKSEEFYHVWRLDKGQVEVAALKVNERVIGGLPDIVKIGGSAYNVVPVGAFGMKFERKGNSSLRPEYQWYEGAD